MTLNARAATPACTEKPAALAAEGNLFLGVASTAAYPQEPVLQVAALQVVLELALQEGGQRPALRAYRRREGGVVLLDDLVEPLAVTQ